MPVKVSRTNHFVFSRKIKFYNSNSNGLLLWRVICGCATEGKGIVVLTSFVQKDICCCDLNCFCTCKRKAYIQIQPRIFSAITNPSGIGIG